MKKILLLLGMCFLFAGCGSANEDKVLSEFKNLVEKNSSYYLEGTMEILSNEKKFTYDVDVSYKQGNYYKVSLTNTENSHEQIILKNEEGVYVITPNLNKSFKFQSDWPNNSSQAYILETVLADIENDVNRTFELQEEKYIVKSGVNYPNNSSLITQRVTFNKKYEPEKIEILTAENSPQITMTVTLLEWNKNYDKEYFLLSSNVEKDCCEDSETTSKLEDVIYPMYIPLGTQFKDQEVVTNEGAQRVILTFDGDKPFILIEEVSAISEEFEVNSASGDLVFYETILGALTDTSVSWTKDGVDYYIIGQNLTEEELLQIASSTATVALVK